MTTIELPHPPDGIAQQTPQILLVEDDPHVAETLGELLELEGYSVRVAHDAATALRDLRQRRSTVVLCDLSLPGSMDGCGFAQACRKDPLLSKLHLIAVSGYDRPEDQRRAKDAGFDRLIGKPVDLERLRLAIEMGRPS